jgi:hypothetical protein
MGVNFPWPAGYMPSDEMPPFQSRPGVNLVRYEAVSHVSGEQVQQLRRMSEDLHWEQDKIFRRYGAHKSHPLVGMSTNLNVETDSDTEFYFLGRKFVKSESPGNHTVACEEDLERNYKQIREARRQADIVMVALHDQSHGTSPHDFNRTFAEGAIDAGADVFFNNGGFHRGIEIYKGKPILWGIPSFYLQVEAVDRLPSSVLSRYGLPSESTTADIISTRAANMTRAAKEAGGLPNAHKVGGSGSAISICVFDDRAALKEIRIQPIEPLGRSIQDAIYEDAGDAVPRFHIGRPQLPAPGSVASDRVLEHIVEWTKSFDTPIEIRDGVAVVTF